MLAIFKKEVKGYFHSVIGWLYLAVFTFFASLFFTIYNMLNGSPHAYYTFSGMMTVLLFITPVLTMRIIAEEKRQKSEQLLLTAPVGPFQIVFGKYLALLSIFTMGCIPLAIYPLILGIYGYVPMGETYISLLGFFLFGAAVLAIGMLVSSLTEKQVIAVILTYVIFLGMMLVPSFFSALIPKENLFLTIVKKLDITEPAYQFFSGTFDLLSMLYLLSVIAIFIILTYRSVGKQTFSVSSRGMRRVLFSVGGTLLTVVLIIGANIGASYIPKKYTQFDITDTKMYSLTSTTKEVLQNLDKDITIYCLAEKGTADKIVTQYLESYTEESNRVKLEFVSFASNPSFYSKYTDQQPSQNSLIVTSGDKSQVIDYNDCYVHETGIDYQTYQSYDNVTAVDVEGRVTAAISMLDAEKFPTMMVIEGHSETDITDYALSALSKSGYVMSSANLMSLPEIPDTTDLVVINAPQFDLPEQEISLLKKYIDNGGNAIFILSAPNADTPNYNSFIETLGVTVTDGVIIDNNANYFYQNFPYALIPKTEYHPITSNLGSRKTFCSLTRGLLLPESNATVTYNALISSSDDSFCKVDLTSQSLDKTDGDIDGPFALGAYLQLTHENGETSGITVFASDQFLLTDVDNLVSHANADMFLGAVKSSSQTELASAVSAKSLTYDNITTEFSIVIVFSLVCVLLIPVCFVACGIIVWAIRRKK